MNRSKLGHRISSSVLATALVFAPVQGVLAAPADGAEAPADGAEAPADGSEAPADGAEAPAETEQPAEGEGDTTEVEAPAEGEGDGTEITVPSEGETAEGETAEGEPAETETEVEPPAEEEQPSEEESEMEVPAPSLETTGPLRPPEPTWGPRDQYPMKGKGMLIAGGTVTGLGAAFIVASLLITRCDFESSLRCKFGDQRNFLVPVAVATTGLGLLLTGVGIGSHVRYKRWEKWTPETAVVPTMMGKGGGVSWVGRF